MGKKIIISKVGGALEEDYHTLLKILSNLNTSYFPFFSFLGFNSEEDTDAVIDILLSNYPFITAKEKFIEKGTEQVRSGKVRIEDVISKYTQTKEYPTPEERERIYDRELHRKLALTYRTLRKKYHEKMGLPSGGYPKKPIEVCRKALLLTTKGFIVDEDKFVEIYWDYLEANDSQTGKLHQEAAEAVNRFFGGQIEITEIELGRYFVLEDGILIPNPKSINREDYMRLGYRGKKQIKSKKV